MIPIIFFVGFCCALCQCATLPNYIIPCGLSDPNLNKCMVENANRALPEILKGDKKYKVPNMLPMIIPKIDLTTGSNLKIVLTDAKIGGLDTMKITGLTLDNEKKQIQMKISINPLSIQADYDINGQILILTISGNGPSNITLANGDYTYTMNYKTITKNGEEYYQVDNSVVDAKIGRAHFHFENLFNGDKSLGDQMNQFIDENWEEFLKELHPATVKVMAAVVDNTFEGYFSNVPAKDVFKP